MRQLFGKVSHLIATNHKGILFHDNNYHIQRVIQWRAKPCRVRIQEVGYRCVSREVLAQATKDYGVEEEILSKALTEKPGILERMAAERSHYIAYVRAALINEVKDGNIVYHGNAGHFLLKDVPQVLKVRVVASMEYRIDAAMTRNHLDREEATRYIEKKDEERAAWTRFLYHVDWRNPDLYDMIINLDRMSLESACKLVCDAASLDEYKAPADWEKICGDLIQKLLRSEQP